MSVCTIDVGLELRKANEEGFQEGYKLGTVHSMSACTDEEFKAEAKRRGYNLIKIPENVKLLPCVCGNEKHHRVFIMSGLQYYSCRECGLVAEDGKTERQTKFNWNKMIEEKMKDGKAD